MAEKTQITRADLEKQVRDGTITQQQSDDLWDAQVIDRAADIATQRAVTVSQSATALTNINASIDRYLAQIPDLAPDKKDSDARKRVLEKFEYVTKTLGLDATKGLPEARCELMALELAFGPIDALEAAKSRGDRLAFEGGGAGGGVGGGRDVSNDGRPKGLTQDQIRHYEFQIGQGLYADWDAVKAELDRDKQVRGQATSRNAPKVGAAKLRTAATRTNGAAA